MQGYSEHIQLSDDEIQRLPSILNMRALWSACLEYRMAVDAWQAPRAWTRVGCTQEAPPSTPNDWRRARSQRWASESS